MTCGGCETPTSDGIHLCPGCRDQLMDDLRDVESTVGALWASACKLDVGNGSVGTSGHSSPTEPTNARAYDAGRTLNVILTGWARALDHHEPHAVRAANTLLNNINEVRAADWAATLKQELRDALNDCRAAMDRGGKRVFAGICPTDDDGEECGTPVYTPEGRVDARCGTCGATWDVTDWRERALIAAGPVAATALELTRILSDPARALTFPKNKVAVWVSRRKLQPIGYREDGRAVYQVRKVRNLWERSILESAVRSERIMAARLERQRPETDEARHAA